MKVDVAPGKYVVAVSGGVDSVVLLDILSQHAGLELVVAHFDHGIRKDSALDKQFVEALAQRYGLLFISGVGNLGAEASEATARRARYDFLRQVREQYEAAAIITAHHQDDVLETAIINLLRGTYRHGLSALRSTSEIQRPLLPIPKQTLLEYARTHQLRWHEDSTNNDEVYLRNYIRRHIIPRFSAEDRRRFLMILDNADQLNQATDELMATLLTAQEPSTLGRLWFQQLPHAVARDTMASWLRSQGIGEFERPLLEDLVVAAKTLSPGKQRDINTGYILKIGRDKLALIARER